MQMHQQQKRREEEQKQQQLMEFLCRYNLYYFETNYNDEQQEHSCPEQEMKIFSHPPFVLFGKCSPLRAPSGRVCESKMKALLNGMG